MSRSVIILKPRLDIPFKKGPEPRERGPIQPIRRYWEDFVNSVKFHHRCEGDDVVVKEMPLWRMNPHDVRSWDADLTYIPHHDKDTFDPTGHLEQSGMPTFRKLDVLYYMQMAYPWLFQTDPKGWCARSSEWPLQPNHELEKLYWFDQYKTRQMKGFSKFPQPPRRNGFGDGYIFFPCQIPHDQSIKLDSDVEVLQALTTIALWCKENNIGLIVKGHPVNPTSMIELKGAFSQLEWGQWEDDVNINDLIEGAAAVVSVNSGVGMDTILHEKPVFIFGRADYQAVAHSVSDSNSLDEAWANRDQYIKDYRAFINTYVDSMWSVRALNNLPE